VKLGLLAGEPAERMWPDIGSLVVAR
jgi:hypothetical protein